MDQPFNAAQVVQRQAGLWIPRKRYTVRRAEQALKALLFVRPLEFLFEIVSFFCHTRVFPLF
jgi:hypothetical protein